MNDIWKREPAQLLGLIFAFLTGATAFVAITLAELPAGATWLEVVLVAAGFLLPQLQGWITRSRVFSPATFEHVARALSRDN